MRINRVMAGAVASVLALGAVTPAFADNDHRDRREWREDRREWRQDRRDWVGARPPRGPARLGA